jgi:hypothetical protein
MLACQALFLFQKTRDTDDSFKGNVEGVLCPPAGPVPSLGLPYPPPYIEAGSPPPPHP